MLDRTFCCAPLMDWSDRHCRYLWRLMSKNALVYTEMITTGAIIYGDNQERFLGYNQEEHPVAIQLGGSNPKDLAQCAQLAQKWGYDEVNLNVGCPSDRVQNGQFGACLMAEPQLVRDGIKAMQDNCDIPVTIKHRIGIDDLDSYQWLSDFVATVAESGCTTFIVHARKAILSGLSPKQNREIPPLSYPTVYQLKQDFPQLEFVLNGGIENLAQCKTHLQHVNGVMLGRAAYQNPWMLNDVDPTLFSSPALITSPEQLVESYLPYIQNQLDAGAPLMRMSKHLLGVFQGVPGARQFRRHLSESGYKKGAGIEIVEKALSMVKEAKALAVS
ncbi:MAG: tRNA-dihydrouridine synthase A [Pseudomonadales bacterium]|jgi:tRNA-dihydrouridine synthase A